MLDSIKTVSAIVNATSRLINNSIAQNRCKQHIFATDKPGVRELHRIR